MAYERKTPGKGLGARSGGKSSGPKKFGDRKPSGKFGDKPRGEKSFGDKKFGDRKPRSRSEGGFSDRPKRDFSDRPKRDFGDRPKRDFGDRPPRSRSEGSFSDRPKRDFADRPPRSRDGDFERKPRREFSDRPKHDFGDRPKRDFGDRPARSFDDRPKRDFGDRPKRDFGDRPPRSRDGDFERKPRREFSVRPKRDFSDRPKRDFSDRPKRDYSDRPAKSYARKEFKPKDRFEDQDENGMQGHELVLFGIHAVQAALKNTARKITKIWATERGLEHLEGHHDADRHPEVEMVEKRDLERKVPENAVHQGIAMAAEPLDEIFMSDILNAARAPNAGRHIVVILDEVSDPHNVGAVLRSMSVFGAKAMIVHKRNAPGMTGTMAKIATGAVEHVPMLPVVNLGGAIEELKEAGFFCLGLDENADYPLSSAPTDEHIALVLGAEGEGLREKTRSLCDAIANIPSFGDIKSLNVSNAAAIALYEMTRGK